MYLQSETKVTALCVSDQTGSHGTVGTPAPLQITHCVLVQVACCHQRAAWLQTSRRELQTALGCQETVKRHDRNSWKGNNREHCGYANTACVHPWSDLRGVILRNIFNPIRGPRICPAPNSTSRDKSTELIDVECMSKINKLTNKQTKNNPNPKPTTKSYYLPLGTKYFGVVYIYLAPALGWCNSSYSHANVAPTISVVCRQGTWQHCSVRVRQRSLKKDSGASYSCVRCELFI